MTRSVGFIIILMAALYLTVSLVDFLPKYNSVPELVANQKSLGLATTTTNLRFHIGQEIIVDIIVVAVLVLVGWWLTTTETPQYAYVIVLGIVIVASIVIRSTPLIPFNAARLSPQGAFYRAQVKLSVVADTTDQWVVIPVRKNYRVALTETYQDEQLIGKKEVVLDFIGNPSAQDDYLHFRSPVSIFGVMNGTRNLAFYKYIYTVPCVKVREVSEAN